jgi:hypothetical protein
VVLGTVPLALRANAAFDVASDVGEFTRVLRGTNRLQFWFGTAITVGIIAATALRSVG